MGDVEAGHHQAGELIHTDLERVLFQTSELERAESGKAVGTCELVDAVGPLGLVELKQNQDKAGIPSESLRSLTMRCDSCLRAEGCFSSNIGATGSCATRVRSS